MTPVKPLKSEAYESTNDLISPQLVGAHFAVLSMGARESHGTRNAFEKLRGRLYTPKQEYLQEARTTMP